MKRGMIQPLSDTPLFFDSCTHAPVLEGVIEETYIHILKPRDGDDYRRAG
jgi:hypothetical protein